jgi:hypothetical protein
MAPRLLLSCVAEDRPVYHQRVQSLVGSARSLGGALSSAPIVVNMVGGADPGFVRTMQAHDAEVRVVERLDRQHIVHANKLRMFDIGDRDDFDVLLAVDCDIAVAGDPSPLIPGDAIGVVPADVDPLDEQQWSRLLAGLGLGPSPRSVTATTTGRPMHPYFNSGVVTVPRQLCGLLLDGWRDALEDVHSLWLSQPRVISRKGRFFADQYALMAALRRKLPWTALSRELNLATHVKLDDTTVAGLDPVLLHYHEAVDDDGLLFRPRSAIAEAAVERVNRSHAAAHGLDYRGMRKLPLRSQLQRSVNRSLRSRLSARGARLRTYVAREPASSSASASR